MNIEDLAELTADQLNKLPADELKKILELYFNVTRPELAPRPQRKLEFYEPAPILTPAKQKALELLKAEGIDMGFLRRKKR